MPDVVGVVHAKSSSSRVPNKNAQVLGGSPLYLHALRKLRAAGIATVYLDSDDDGFLTAAATEGFFTHRRDPFLATNMVNGHEILCRFADQHPADMYVQLSCTAPFIAARTVARAVAASRRANASAFLITRRREYEWRERAGEIHPAYNWMSLPNSIDLAPRLDEVTGLYAVPAETLRLEGTRVSPGAVALVVSGLEAIDINIPEDLELVRALSEQHPEWVAGDGPSQSEPEELLWPRMGRVQLVVTDVDGTLTSGGLKVSEDGDVSREFSVRDGEAIGLLSALGVEVILASASRFNESIRARADQLAVSFVHFTEDKLACLRRLISERQLSMESVCYVGDSHLDIGCLQNAGLSVVPGDAPTTVQQHADWVLDAGGGDGVLMEIYERLRVRGRQ